jgi:hypothetical protein
MASSGGEGVVATLVRKQIYVDVDQAARLKRLAWASGRTEAAIIRQALDRHLVKPVGARRDPAAWSAERAYLTRLLAEPAPTPPHDWRRDELHER